MSNFNSWLSYFQNNRLNRPEPDWSLPLTLDAQSASVLAMSLSHFQLGESGDGNHLLGKAAKKTSERHLQCLALFIKEEQEHARLLEHLVLRFKGKLIMSHWTDALFCDLRHFLNFNWELQILLTAEIIGTAYYVLMGRHSSDKLLGSICQKIVSDEEKHLQFHHDYFRIVHHASPVIIKMLWNWQFAALLFLTAHLAWFDHGSCLKMLGSSKKDFFSEIKALQNLCLLEPEVGFTNLVSSIER